MIICKQHHFKKWIMLDRPTIQLYKDETKLGTAPAIAFLSYGCIFSLYNKLMKMDLYLYYTIMSLHTYL